MKSYSLWIDKKKQAKIYQKKLVYNKNNKTVLVKTCLLYTSPSPRDRG